MLESVCRGRLGGQFVVNDCGLTDEQLDEMADTLRGTMRSIESYLEQYEIDADPTYTGARARL